jgi:hypothetical protein
MFRSALIRVIHRIRLIRGVPLSFGIWGWITFSHRAIVTQQLKQKFASDAKIPRIVGFCSREKKGEQGESFMQFVGNKGCFSKFSTVKPPQMPVT